MVARRSRRRRACADSVLDCAICLDRAQRPTAGDSCGHTFCYSCLSRWAAHNNGCPTCRQPLRRTPPSGAIRRPPDHSRPLPRRLTDYERRRVEQQVSLLLGLIGLDTDWAVVIETPS